MNCDDSYDPSKFNTSLSLEEIDHFRKRLIQNIAELNLNKAKIRVFEFNELSNYHHYALNILNNMMNIKKVEMSNPYNQHNAPAGQVDTLNPYQDQLKPVYDRHGRIKLVSKNQFNQEVQEEWMTQFNENIMNPPAYTIPPSNCWIIPDKQGHGKGGNLS